MSAERHERMTRDLAGYPTLVTDEILAAVGAVPRHLFLPGVSLALAYGLGTVVTHRDEDGVALSSATGLTAVAGMLRQLDVRSSHRVLEIGAGTGFNAALLAHLVDPSGTVVTIDLDANLIASAWQALDQAGYPDVEGDLRRRCPRTPTGRPVRADHRQRAVDRTFLGKLGVSLRRIVDLRISMHPAVRGMHRVRHRGVRLDRVARNNSAPHNSACRRCSAAPDDTSSSASQLLPAHVPDRGRRICPRHSNETGNCRARGI